jgi:glycosyltransferase involved in cell wall biosynthesis
MKMDSLTPADHRVGLAHDWLTGMRGGEKVLELLCRRFPEAPLWTLIHNPDTVSPAIANRPIHTSLLQGLPFANKKYRLYLPFFPFFAETNKVSNADIVVSTSHAVAKSMVKRGGKHCKLHICYIHTPMRYAWDLFDEYFGPEQVGWLRSQLFFKPLLRWVKWYDRATVKRVDLFIANSTYVADRVRRCYGRKAVVLPPPVDLKRFAEVRREPEDWFLVVSALVPYKRVDHAIRACARLDRRLKIVGTGPETEGLRKLSIELGASVDFIGFASDQELVSCYSRAKALLFPGVEDFGIVPVEAIAAGCPVIAFKEGGILDSMTEETAAFYSDQSADGLTAAITNFEATQSRFVETVLRKRAALFGEAAFLKGFEQLLQTALTHMQASAGRTPALDQLSPTTETLDWSVSTLYCNLQIRGEHCVHARSRAIPGE